MDPQRARALGLVTCDLGAGQELVCSEFSRARGVLPSAEIDALLACGEFRTVEEQARAAGVSVDQVEQWVHAGFLLTRRALLDRARAAEASPPPGVATVGVVTRNRPESLERCLDSFARNARSFGRSPRIVVADDTSPGAVQDRNRAALARVRSATQARLFYAGIEEKTRFAQALEAQGTAPPELIRFALFDPERTGYTAGANRNALLLASLGGLLVSLDDDIVCRMTSVPKPREDWVLTSDSDPTEFWFHPDRKAALDSADCVERDFLGAHEGLLGRSLSSCLAVAGEKVDLDGIDARFLRTLQSGMGRVRVTQAGYLGDSGMGSSAWLLSRTGATRDRLIASESGYRLALESRSQLRAAPGPTLTNSSFFLTGACGLDLREASPPFIPVQRNSDGVLAVTLRQCFPNSLTGHVPWALLHDPPEQRSDPADGVWKAVSRILTADVVISCLSMVDLGPAKPDGADRLRALGTHLQELGGLPLKDFEWLLRNILWLRGGNAIARGEVLLAQYAGSPGYWAQDIRRSQEAIRQAMIREDYLVPGDLLNGRSPEEARALSQRIVRKFGELLVAWPEIVRGAQELQARGVSFAKEL